MPLNKPKAPKRSAEERKGAQMVESHEGMGNYVVCHSVLYCELWCPVVYCLCIILYCTELCCYINVLYLMTVPNMPLAYGMSRIPGLKYS